MDNSQRRRKVARDSRVLRVRKNIRGTAEKPRLTVSKTNQHLYAQLVDDEKGITLAGIGTLSKPNQSGEFKRKSKESARRIGVQIAEFAKKLNINAVIFDRGRYKFHGVIAELANSAREAGLQF
ncbi:MAG: 50S ribosomal protein L18 [Verrucomicrobiota bacterium]|nr:50S ribosomal protein L18 [Verrucomicrobiota bacterium]